MSHLEQLSFSNAAAPKPDKTPVGRFRQKIVEAIDLQLAMIEAEASGTVFKPTRTRAFKNADGVRERRDIAVRLQPWWWTDGAGTTFLSIRHGGRVIEVAPGKTAIKVGTMEDLPAKLAILRDAARAGELDGCRDQAMRGRAVPGSRKEDGEVPSAASRKASRKPANGPSAAAA